MHLNYPLYAEPWFILVFFCVSLVIVHFGLLWALRDDVLKWHKLDYIWLPMALFGLLGQTQSNKVEVGKNISVFWLNQENAELRELNRLVNSYSNENSYPCVKGVWSEYSPPRHIFESIDRDDQRICDWYKSLRPIVPTTKTGLDDFLSRKLPEPPKLSGHSGSGPEDAVNNFQDTLASLKDVRVWIAKNEEEMKSSHFLQVLRMFSPLLICFALAIRITKVTGEARLKKTKPQ
jgi:hypothetical protein